MNEYLRRLMAERDSLIQTATGMAESAAAAERDLTETERATLSGMQARGAEIDAQLTSIGEQQESVRAYASLRAQLNEDHVETRQPAAITGRAAVLEARSWGEQFVDSGILDGYSGRGTSDRVTLPGIMSRAAEDPIMLSTLPAQVMPRTLKEVSGPAQAFPLLGAVSREVVSTNAVDFIRWLPNPDTAAALVAEGALKPAYDVTASVTSDTLDTYAGWKAITRQALEDFPRIQSIVETKLRNSLAARAHTEIATLLAAAVAGAGDGAGDLSAAIRVAVGNLQGKGYSPNAVALNPADWAGLDVAGTQANNPGGFWGLTPISVPELAAGTVVVGDFKTAITLFDRGQTSVFVTDSHADFFLRNQLVILAEARMLAAAVEPGAMEKVTVGVAPVAPAAASAARR